MTLHSQSSGVTEYYWDEVNRLRVVNSEKLMHHYFYDATGERVLKAATSQEDVYENGQAVLSQVYLNNFTTYPSGFIVVEPDGRYTKHYYAGTQRVASQTGDVYASSIFGRPENNGGSTAFNPAEHKQQLLRDMLQYAAKTGQELPKFKESKEGDSSTTAQDHRAKLISELYFYHPDHLGTSTYVTDGQGFAYQFFLNLPFGETDAGGSSNTNKK